ncbi:MAG TPA: FkbM family methyltransferase [Verrucomicrobiae bacterium]|jgi:FkbM family methyltransferase
MWDDLAYRLSKNTAARQVITPLLRSYLRYFPGAAGKETLWNRVVNPYLAWQSRKFVARTHFGQRLAGDTKDMIQQYIYFFGLWEPVLTAWICSRLSPGDGFIDVGANIGYYSLLASTLVGKSGSVVAIEASPRIFRELQKNLARNCAVNVRGVNVAVSDHKGLVRLFRGPDHNLGETSVFQAAGFTPDGTVEAAPLAEILEGKELASARLIKIDIEGAERIVVPGIGSLLRSGRADLELIVEFHPQYLTEPGRRAEDLVKLVNAAGFHAYRLENDYWPFNRLKNSASKRPARLRAPIQGETVIVFSRKDTESL